MDNWAQKVGIALAFALAIYVVYVISYRKAQK